MTSLLRLPTVVERTGLSKPIIYHRIKSGLLPAPVKNGERISVWPDNEIEAINRARIAGKSDDEIRTLVSDLTRQRAAA